jgi:hypothetical protein
MNDQKISYARWVGYLESVLKGLTTQYEIPGVVITDREMFKQFIAKELDKAEKFSTYSN